MVLKVLAGSSRLTLVLLAVVMATCAGCSILLYALADVTRQGNPVPAALDSREIELPQIMFARDPVDRLALIGRSFDVHEPVIVWYSPSPITTTEEILTVTVAYTDENGTFSQLLADVRTRVPAQGWFVAQGKNSGRVTPLIPYSAELTATPLPTLTLTPTPTPTANTPMPTATSTQPPTVPPTIVPSPTLNPNPFEGWYAEYYDNRDLAGEPFYTRNEYPDGEWMCEFNPSWHPLQAEFQRKVISARWTGTFYFPSNDNYQFVIQASDGVRIIIDGVAYINDWRFTSKVRTLIQNVPLTQGNHIIVIEYFHLKGRGAIGVSWQVAYPDWEGRYYNTPNFSGPVIAKRNDGTRSGPLQLLTDGSPAPGVNPENFSVYWSRKVAFKHSGLYIFKGVADDGIRVFIDDQEVFRQNTSGGQSAFEFPMNLRGGHHVIQIHYYDLTGRAQLEFAWEWVPPTPTPEPTPVL